MAQDFWFHTFFRYWMIGGILILGASGVWAINALFTATPDLLGSTIAGVVVAFGGAGILAFLSHKMGVFTRSK